MSGKGRVKKGIVSIEKQIRLHKEKLSKAEEGNVGLINYYEKEIENFERVKEKLRRKIDPKSRRK
jgi:hypothetical protein